MSKRGPKTGRRSQSRPRKANNDSATPEVDAGDTESTAGIGDNSGETETLEKLTDEQQRVLFVQHVVKIERLKNEIEEATRELKADLKDALKLAKAEGYSKKDIDFALR